MFVWETIRFLAVDLFLNVVYFPVWWYTVGTWQVLQLIGRQLHQLAEALNLRILFTYLFKPMFGQSDIWGRIISLYVRLAQFFVLLIVSLVSAIAFIALLIVWVLLPPFILYNAALHFGLTDFNLYG